MTTPDLPDHIAIVDDDREIRELLATYLRKHGFKVSLAADGRQLHALLEHDAIDLVVLDLMMPGEDGLAVCRTLRISRSTAYRTSAERPRFYERAEIRDRPDRRVSGQHRNRGCIGCTRAHSGGELERKVPPPAPCERVR